LTFNEFRVLFLTVTGVLALLVASPALSRVLVYPRTEFFTELWILDANRRAEDYPFNIARNYNYSIFLGVGNRLGYCAYYLVEVKLRNQSQPAPTSFGPNENRTPSSMPSLFYITAFVADEQVWELPLTFSFDYGYNETFSQVEFYSLTLNNIVINLNGYEVVWDSSRKGFFVNLFFELWLYNASANDFYYHGRFVDLWLNMTV